MTLLEKREAIATLPGHVGYQALLEILDNIVHDAVLLTVTADSEEKTLKAARNLQALFKYLEILKTYPQEIQTEFEETKRLLMESGEDPIFTPQRRNFLQELENNYDPNTGQKKRKVAK